MSSNNRYTQNQNRRGNMNCEEEKTVEMIFGQRAQLQENQKRKMNWIKN